MQYSRSIRVSIKTSIFSEYIKIKKSSDFLLREILGEKYVDPGSGFAATESSDSLDLQFCSLTCKLMFYFYDLVFYFNFYWIGLNSFVKTNKKVIFIREILLISLNACKIRYFSIFFSKNSICNFLLKYR